MLHVQTYRACCLACYPMPRSQPPPVGTWCGVPVPPVWWPVAPAGSPTLHSPLLERNGYRYERISIAIINLVDAGFCILDIKDAMCDM